MGTLTRLMFLPTGDATFNNAPLKPNNCNVKNKKRELSGPINQGKKTIKNF